MKKAERERILTAIAMRIANNVPFTAIVEHGIFATSARIEDGKIVVTLEEVGKRPFEVRLLLLGIQRS